MCFQLWLTQEPVLGEAFWALRCRHFHLQHAERIPREYSSAGVIHCTRCAGMEPTAFLVLVPD